MSTRQNLCYRILLGAFLASLLVGCASAKAPATVVGQRPGSSPLDRPTVKAVVVREAMNLGVSPSLALAVAHAESNFNPRALSSKGARGVMQVMPATARGEYGIDPDRLWDVRVNVRLGLHFLRRLIDRYDGRTDLALSYYNGGSAVGRLPRARVIPATRHYVAKVQQLQADYRRRIIERSV